MAGPRPAWWLLPLLTLAGCGGADVRPIALRPGAVYTSRLGNFTIVVPSLLEPGVHESDSATADRSADGVSFADDFGIGVDVRSRRIAADDPRAKTKSGARAAADRYLDEVVSAELGGSTVLHADAHVDTAAGPARFAVVRPSDGRAVRGIVAFPQLGWAYAVEVRAWPRTPNQPPLTDADRDAHLLADLRQAVAQMTFH